MPLTSPARRRLCHVSPSSDLTPRAADVLAWASTSPPVTATARELLPSFLAALPPSRFAWTPARLGAALAALGAPRRMRSGTATWQLPATPPRGPMPSH